MPYMVRNTIPSTIIFWVCHAGLRRAAKPSPIPLEHRRRAAEFARFDPVPRDLVLYMFGDSNNASVPGQPQKQLDNVHVSVRARPLPGLFTIGMRIGQSRAYGLSENRAEWPQRRVAKYASCMRVVWLTFRCAPSRSTTSALPAALVVIFAARHAT